MLGEVVGHVWIYVSKAAEGLASFNIGLIWNYDVYNNILLGNIQSTTTTLTPKLCKNLFITIYFHNLLLQWHIRWLTWRMQSHNKWTKKTYVSINRKQDPNDAAVLQCGVSVTYSRLFYNLVYSIIPILLLSISMPHSLCQIKSHVMDKTHMHQLYNLANTQKQLQKYLNFTFDYWWILSFLFLFTYCIIKNIFIKISGAEITQVK